MPSRDPQGASGVAGDFRFGYVALVGRPNVGKSTLMNQILGQKVSIVTHKPQTTRQRIAGIKTTGRGQVVYLDTPGIHRSTGRALNRYMNRVAKAAFRDVDAVLFLIEAGRWTRQDRAVAQLLQPLEKPCLLVINKIDQIGHKQELLAFIAGVSEEFAADEVLLVSALRGDGVAELEARLLQLLPFSRPWYDEDQITDRSERFLVAELLREALTLRLHKEVPYSLTVEIEEFKRRDGQVRIGAIIWVERESQKQIVIGRGGRVLKQVGIEARRAMQELLGEPVHLRTWVKVSRDWSRDDQRLERLGFGD